MRPFLIAEIGNNHNGDESAAIDLVERAIAAGFDAVKFQTRNPAKAIPKLKSDVSKQTPWGEMSYFEYRKKLELPPHFWDKIGDLTAGRIRWLSSVWDYDSLEIIGRSKSDYIKIPSAMNNSWNFIKSALEYDKKIIVALGGLSTEEVRYLIENFSGAIYAYLHCTSLYPPQPHQLNLAFLSTLKSICSSEIVGYSCHTPMAAAALGAEIIEVHITHSREAWGTDHKISFQTDELADLVRGIRQLEIEIGSAQKCSYPAELARLAELTDRPPRRLGTLRPLMRQ